MTGCGAVWKSMCAWPWRFVSSFVVCYSLYRSVNSSLLSVIQIVCILTIGSFSLSFSLSFFDLLVLFIAETFELKSSLILDLSVSSLFCLFIASITTFLPFWIKYLCSFSVFFFNSGFSGYLRHFKVHS